MRPCFRFLFLPSLTLYATASSIPSLLLNPSLSLPSAAHPAASNLLPSPPLDVTTTTTVPSPAFLVTVMYTVLKTTRHYPTATFRLVRVSSSSGPATALENFTNIGITFSIRDPIYNSINVYMTARWSVWAPPVFSHHEVPNKIGNMRLDVIMDIREAWQIMKGLGSYETFESVILYWPTLPPKPSKQQPFYRFKVLEPEKVFVYVGAWTKKATETDDSGGLDI